MSDFFFLSDFDGTMASRDFYEIFAEEYRPDIHQELKKDLYAGKMSGFAYLQKLFSSLDISTEEFQKEIDRFTLDPAVVSTINWLNTKDVGFAVVSAGCELYIKPIMERYALGHIPLYTNPGEFRDGALHLFERTDHFASPTHGIAKEKVLSWYRQKHETIIFAGDGRADNTAAEYADIRFARGYLAQHLSDKELPFHQFSSYEDIFEVLKSLYIK